MISPHSALLKTLGHTMGMHWLSEVAKGGARASLPAGQGTGRTMQSTLPVLPAAAV